MRQLKITQQITNRDTQSVEKYLQEVSQIDMISPEDETKFARIIQTADPNSKEYQNALDSLTKANLRFVVSVAKQYQHQGLALSDLINEGNLGLIKAGTRFDETRGFKFISYAVWRIRQSILQALAEQGRLVKLPQNKIGIYNKVSKARNAFEQIHEREPSDEELAEITELSLNDIHVIIATNTRHTSLDAGISNDETDSITLIDTIESTKESLALGFEDHSELSETMQEALKKGGLTPRELEIILATFGFQGSIEQIEMKYDLTKERIRQIKERAIKKLQLRIKKNCEFTKILRGDERAKVNETNTSRGQNQGGKPKPKDIGVNEENITTGTTTNSQLAEILGATTKPNKKKNSVPKIYDHMSTHNINVSHPKESIYDTKLIQNILRIVVKSDWRTRVHTRLAKNPDFIPIVDDILSSYALAKNNNLSLQDRIINAKHMTGNQRNGANSIRKAIEIVINN